MQVLEYVCFCVCVCVDVFYLLCCMQDCVHAILLIRTAYIYIYT